MVKKGQKDKHDLQNIAHKTKDWVTRTQLKMGTLEGQEVPAYN